MRARGDRRLADLPAFGCPESPRGADGRSRAPPAGVVADGDDRRSRRAGDRLTPGPPVESGRRTAARPGAAAGGLGHERAVALAPPGAGRAHGAGRRPARWLGSPSRPCPTDWNTGGRSRFRSYCWGCGTACSPGAGRNRWSPGLGRPGDHDADGQAGACAPAAGGLALELAERLPARAHVGRPRASRGRGARARHRGARSRSRAVSGRRWSTRCSPRRRWSRARAGGRRLRPARRARPPRPRPAPDRRRWSPGRARRRA